MRQISLGMNQSYSNCPRVQIIPELYKIIFLISTYHGRKKVMVHCTFHAVEILNASEMPKRTKISSLHNETILLQCHYILKLLM
jgi:hypothetical protein